MDWVWTSNPRWAQNKSQDNCCQTEPWFCDRRCQLERPIWQISKRIFEKFKTQSKLCRTRSPNKSRENLKRVVEQVTHWNQTRCVLNNKYRVPKQGCKDVQESCMAQTLVGETIHRRAPTAGSSASHPATARASPASHTSAHPKYCQQQPFVLREILCGWG